MSEKFLEKLEELAKSKSLRDIESYPSKEYLSKVKAEHKRRIKEIVNYKMVKVAFYISQVESRFLELTDNTKQFQNGMGDMNRMEKELAEIDLNTKNLKDAIEKELEINQNVKEQLETKIRSITKIYDEKNEEYGVFNQSMKVDMG